MEDKYVQALRYKLQKRVRRVNSASVSQFNNSLKLLMRFIESMAMLKAVKDDLLSRTAHLPIEADVDRICNGEALVGESEEEAAAIGYVFIARLCDKPDSINLMSLVYHFEGASNFEECNEFVRTTFLEPFYEYLDEHVDDQQAVLYVLRKYKQRCEWFRSDQLRTRLESDPQRGEKVLAFDLYEFLHEQGITFQIEPTSASGIADLVAEQVGDSRVVADAKVFWPDKGKRKPYLLSAFHQAYTYARDLNEPCAYLVVFKNCKEDIHFLVPPTSTLFPSFTVNNKTIFFVVIDLCDHGAPASKRGILKSYDIMAEELIQSLAELEPTGLADDSPMSVDTTT